MIRVGFIGMNGFSHAVQIYSRIRQMSDRFEVAGYCLPENEREIYPERLKCFEGLREISLTEMLEDRSISTVVIETDEIHLTKYALLAAKAGKHIHMEKPGGRDSVAFEQLIDTVKQTGKVWQTLYV